MSFGVRGACGQLLQEIHRRFFALPPQKQLATSVESLFCKVLSSSRRLRDCSTHSAISVSICAWLCMVMYGWFLCCWIALPCGQYKQSLLRGVVIVFSGVFPLGLRNIESEPLYRRTIQFGAR